ncbi:MAG: hypothetical protein JXA50_00150, partial [Deltaproteobacteria bacterium]|nr:hypothetical protein [Deltaproteobacteria bacterium]
YWKAGDMLQVRDDLRDIDYNYTYDKLHRLLTETNTGAYAPLAFTYNAIGNIMTKTVGSTTFDYAYDTAHKHAVKTITINSTPYQVESGSGL